MSAANLLQLMVSGITVGAVYALLALGYVTILRSSSVVNFAQGDFAMLGALFTVYVIKSFGLPYIAATFLALIASTIAGVLVYQLVVAPLGRGPLLSLIMVTMGASMFIQNGALLAWGPDAQRLPGFTGDSPIRLGDVAILPQSLWILLITVLVLGFLYLLSNYTLFGKAMTATATQPLAASYVGVSAGSMVRFSWVISAITGALAGLALAPIVPMSFVSGSLLGLKGITALIMGGWGLATGAVAGGLALGLVETFGASLLPAGYKDAIAFIVLIGVLYFRPQGIFGSAHTGEMQLK